MTEGQPIPEQEIDILDNPPEKAPVEVLGFLKLARREGSYDLFSKEVRDRLEKHLLQGIPQTEIAKEQGCKKQAVNQTIKKTPDAIFKKMRKRIYEGTSSVKYSEMLESYAQFKNFMNQKKGN